MATSNGGKDFNVADARSDFPALSTQQVYFDNAGGSQVLKPVIDSISNYLSNSNVQLGASYKVAQASTSKYERGYEAAAKFINASADEIVIGPSTTQLFANLSQALTFPPGSEIIISALDHEANISPWVRMARTQKLNIKWWTPSSTSPSSTTTTHPILTPTNLRPLLSRRTKLVTCTHASNILGTIHDIRALAAEVHSCTPSGLLCVDGVALSPHRAVDVKSLDVDFYAWSWYKVYGPHIATLYASPRAMPHVQSLGHFFHTDMAKLSTKLGLAAASYELVAALPQVLGYFGEGQESRNGAFERIAAHEERIQGVLLGYLNGREDVTVYGETRAESGLRVPVISFSVRGRGSRGIVEAIEERSGYACRWGHFYSKRLVDEVLGVGVEGRQGEEGEGVARGEGEGVVRVSMVFYNTEEEIRGFVKVLDEVLSEKSA